MFYRVRMWPRDGDRVPLQKGSDRQREALLRTMRKVLLKCGAQRMPGENVIMRRVGTKVYASWLGHVAG